MFAILHINQKGIEILHFKKYKKKFTRKDNRLQNCARTQNVFIKKTSKSPHTHIQVSKYTTFLCQCFTHKLIAIIEIISMVLGSLQMNSLH